MRKGRFALVMTLCVSGLAAAATLSGAGFSARAQDAPGGVTSVKVSEEGKQVYEQICQACHMADAKGSAASAGAKIPALANNPHLADPKYPIGILLKGRGAMPWFTEILTPAQMAAVITYVRGHFNDYHDPVTEADVKNFAATPPVRDCMTC